jgi:hypothetical protein
VGVNRPVFGAVPSGGGAVVVALLVGNSSDVAGLAFGAAVPDAIITAFTAAIFAFKLNTFLLCFFFWVWLPCPGPGMAKCRK